MSRNSVTILGAGLCGSLLSIVLARRGMKVTVLDQRPDPRIHGGGRRQVDQPRDVRARHSRP